MPSNSQESTWKKTPDGIPIPPPSDKDVIVKIEDNIATVTLNRPLVLNALSKNVQRLLLSALQNANDDDDVFVIVLTGAGRAFSAGGDMWSHLYPDEDVAPSGPEVQRYIWNMEKPVIAAVRGHAVGQGFELAATCDFTIASENARLGEIQIRHGFGVPMLITPFLVGLKKAKEILMLGNTLTADQACEYGIVNIVVPDEELEKTAHDWAKKLVQLPQNSVRTNKALIRRVYELAGFSEAIDYHKDEEIQNLLDTDNERAASQHEIRTTQGWEAFKQNRDQHYTEN